MRSLFSADKPVTCRVEKGAYDDARCGVGREAGGRRCMQHADEGPTGNRGQGTRENIYTRALACTLLALQPTHRPPASRPAPHPASYALLSTRQSASAFNQPLSFDTSSVTDMSDMFRVRSGRAPTSTWIPARSWSLLAPHYSPLLAHSHHSPPHPRHRRARRLSTSRSVLTRLASQP